MERAVALVPRTVCHEGLGSYFDGPPPLPLQPVSLLKLLSVLRFKVVPPAATTKGEALGYSVTPPVSPLDAK